MLRQKTTEPVLGSWPLLRNLEFDKLAEIANGDGFRACSSMQGNSKCRLPPPFLWSPLWCSKQLSKHREDL